MAFNGYLTSQQIAELTRAALSGGLIEAPRQVLLAGIPPAFAATLPRADAPLDQFALDLVRVNGVKRMAGGEIPALILLRNGAEWMRMVGREEAEVFERALSSITDASARLPAHAPGPQGTPNALTAANSAGGRAGPIGQPGTSDPTARPTDTTPAGGLGEGKVADDPAAVGDGQSHRGRTRSPLRRLANWFQELNVTIQVAIIGGLFTVLAAVVTGIFTLISAGGSPPGPGSSSPSVSPTVPRPSQSRGAAHSLVRLPSKGADAVAFSFDGNFLAAGNANGVIRVWRTDTWQVADRMTDPHSRVVTSVAFDRDGLLASGDANGHVYLWPDKKAKALSAPGITSVRSVAFSHDGQYLAAGDAKGNVYIWQVSSHALAGTLTDPSGGVVTSVAFDRDGLLASGDANGHVYLWPDKKAKALSAPGITSVRSVAFSHDGQYLAAGDAKGNVYIWQVSSHALAGTLTDPSGGVVTSVAFDRDGLLASGDANGHVYLWPDKKAKALSAPGITSVRSVAFSHDGQYLAAGDAKGNVYIWQVSSHALRRTLTDRT